MAINLLTVVIAVKTYTIIGYNFIAINDVLNQCVVFYSTKDVDGNVLQPSLSRAITGTDLSTLMNAVVTTSATRANEIRNALYTFMVNAGIFA